MIAKAFGKLRDFMRQTTKRIGNIPRHKNIRLKADCYISSTASQAERHGYKMKAYVLLANGFEEVEALTTADILARAGIEVKMMKVPTPDGEACKAVSGSHGFKIKTDLLLSGEFPEGDCHGQKAPLPQSDAAEAVAKLSDGDCVVLPGGMPGTTNLGASEAVLAVVKDYYTKGKIVAAICAAPSVLGDNGYLQGRKATCFPGFESRLAGANVTGSAAEIDGNIVTGKSMGSAITFGLKVVEALLGNDAADKVEANIYRG